MIKELKYKDIVEQKARSFKYFLRNYDLIVFPDSQVKDKNPRPRLALHVLYCTTFGRSSVTRRQIEQLAHTWQQEKPTGLVSSAAGSVFDRRDLKRWITDGLAKHGIRVPDDAGDRPLWLFAIDETYYFGFPRYNHHQFAERARMTDRSGSLPPIFASAICFAAKPQPNEIVVDPVVGTGTLLREIAVQAPGSELIGVDLDPEALQIARTNCADLPHLRLIRDDSMSVELPRCDITLTVANLPFGKQFVSAHGNQALYEGILRNLLRFAAPQWRASIITSDTGALEEAVAAIPNLLLQKIAGVRVRGEAATIWLISRT